MTDILDRLQDPAFWNTELMRDCYVEIERLRALLKEAADELTTIFDMTYPHRKDDPDEMRRYKRDMELVNRIREALGDE